MYTQDRFKDFWGREQIRLGALNHYYKIHSEICKVLCNIVFLTVTNQSFK